MSKNRNPDGMEKNEEIIEALAAFLRAGLIKIVDTLPDGEPVFKNTDQWLSNPNVPAAAVKAGNEFKRLPAEEQEAWLRIARG